MQKKSFNFEEILAFAYGTLVSDPLAGLCKGKEKI